MFLIWFLLLIAITSDIILTLDILYFRSGYEEENIYAKVDDMTYYPVVPQVPPPPVSKISRSFLWEYSCDEEYLEKNLLGKILEYS